MADDTRGYRKDPYGRSGAGASGQASDPLTELARLIGQSDPFAPDAGGDRRPGGGAADARAPQSDWRNHPPPGDPQYDPSGEGFGAMPDPKLGHARYDDAGYRSASGQTLPDDATHDQDYGEVRSHDHEAPYYDASEHGQGHDDGYYDDAPGPRRRGGLITAAALLGLAVIGTAGAFAYRTVFTTSGPPSIIARDAGPNKIVPTTQTADTSSSKQIYDRAGDRSQNERIVPREEQPLNLPDPARAAAPRALGQNSAAAIPGMPGGAPARPGVPADASALAPMAAGGEPKKIRTVTIKSDQPSPDPAPTRPVAPPRAAPANPNAPLSLSPQSASPSGPQNSPQGAPPAPPPARAAAIAPPPPVATGADSAAGYFVQVAAQKSEEEAQASYRGIQTKYASVLGGREPVIRRKDLGSKGVFFGAQVGPFSREDAVQLCNSLKSAGGTCMIQKN
jgi:hypothetical protein